MRFYDCNVFVGYPPVRQLFEPADTASLLKEMDWCGVDKALAWHAAQIGGGPEPGNRLLAAAIEGQERLSGCWCIQPNQAREFPPFEQYLEQMRSASVRALRAFPLDHHFLLNKVSMGDWLEGMVANRVPLFLSVVYGANWEIIYQLLAECPELTCVICDHGCWGEDRRFRPLIEAYPNTYIDLSQYLLDGGIEGFVERYGAGRVLFGSGFPQSYMGGMMMALRHAQIAEEDKQAIAAGNLEKLLGEAQS